MEKPKTLSISKKQKIQNLNKMSNYNLQCINCSAGKAVTTIAHRNSKNGITGWIVVCDDCFGLINKQVIRMVVGSKEKEEVK